MISGWFREKRLQTSLQKDKLVTLKCYILANIGFANVLSTGPQGLAVLLFRFADVVIQMLQVKHYNCKIRRLYEFPL